MPFDLVIDAEHRIVYSRAWGEFTEADVLAHRQQMKANPLFDSSSRQLADFSGVTRLAISAASVRALTSSDPWDSGSRRAFVASADVVFGMARMYATLLGDSRSNIAVFRRADEARRWLGLDEDQPQARPG
jgi:hypothetical protein